MRGILRGLVSSNLCLNELYGNAALKELRETMVLSKLQNKGLRSYGVMLKREEVYKNSTK
jgi:hypothetical protein